MPRPGPKTIGRYSEDFKATVARLSELKGVAAKDVAKGAKLDEKVAAELKELRNMKHDSARLKMENGISKQAIEFTSGARRTSLSASSDNGDDTL